MDYGYWAFISYSSKDTATARKFHRRLETYIIPRDLVGRHGRDGPVPRRLFPSFRDRDELPLSSDLGASIEDALRASRYLIVLCSPHAARSRWVNEEIRFFKSLGRDDQILAVIVDGEPNSSDNPSTAARECFAPALRFRVDASGRPTDQRAELNWDDLRHGGDGWTNTLLKAVAGVTRMGLDAFARRERKRRRRRQVVLGVLALFAAGAGHPPHPPDVLASWRDSQRQSPPRSRHATATRTAGGSRRRVDREPRRRGYRCGRQRGVVGRSPTPPRRVRRG